MPSLDRIKGSIPPLITPFKGGEVDYETYAKIIEFQIAETIRAAGYPATSIIGRAEAGPPRVTVVR